MHKSIFILVTLFSSGVCYAQDLFQLYDSARNTGDMALAEKVVELAIKEKNDKLLADAHFLIGYYKKQDEQFYDAVLNYFEANTIYKELDDWKKLAEVMENAANIYGISGYKDIALGYFKDALNIKYNLADTSGLMVTYFNIGRLYKEATEYDSALIYYNKQLELASIVNNQYEISLAKNSIGIVYRFKRDFVKARLNYKSALDFRGDPEMKGHALNNIGSSYLFEGDTLKALENLQHALRIKEDLSTETLVKLFGNLGSIYESRMSDSAKYFYEMSLSYVEKKPMTFSYDYIHTCAKLMQLYKGGDKEKALWFGDKLAKFATEQIELKEQLKNLNKRYQVEAATWKIENDKKAEKLAEQNLILIYIIIGLLVSMAVLVFLYIANRRKKKELEYYTINTKRLYEVINS